LPQWTADVLVASINKAMSTPRIRQAGWQITLIALLAAGCAQSRFQHDPRAAGIGPDYLDYIQQYPRDRDTQYYYPEFAVDGMTNRAELYSGAPTPEAAHIQPLLTVLPPVPRSVQAIEGKGWPELEREGMPMFLPPQNPSWGGWGWSWTW
jgi:hypothetical protein